MIRLVSIAFYEIFIWIYGFPPRWSLQQLQMFLLHFLFTLIIGFIFNGFEMSSQVESDTFRKVLAS